MEAYGRSAFHEEVEDLSVRQHQDLTYFPHWHSDLEVVFVAEGRIRMDCNLVSSMLVQGSIAVFMPNDVHSFESLGRSRAIAFHIRPELLDPELQKCLLANRFQSPFQSAETIRSAGLSARMESIFRTVLEEETDSGTMHRTAILCRVTEFFVLALRSLPTQEATDTVRGRDRRNIVLMQEIVTYIASNIVEEITLESISEHFHLCPFYFSRLFKRMFGINLKEYVNRSRTSRAKELLFNTDLKITSISFECGYGSVRQFNRIFRENTGYTPSIFRDMRFSLQEAATGVAG